MSISGDNSFPFSDFPDLQTVRLDLKSISPEDASDIFDLRVNPDILQYIDRKQPADIDAAKSFIKYVNNGFSNHELIFWGIRLKSNNQLIGTSSLWHFTDDKSEAEVGYELHPSHWGQGFANEALIEIINFSFEILKLKKLEAFTHRDNIASRQLLSKNKFVLIPSRIDEGHPNNVIYELKGNTR